MAESFLERNSSLGLMQAREAAGPRACGPNHQQQRWIENANKHVCCSGVDGLFHTLCCGKERCNLFWKNSQWLQLRGQEKVKQEGLQERGTAYRKKYLRLLIGCSPKTSCMSQGRWHLVVARKVERTDKNTLIHFSFNA